MNLKKIIREEMDDLQWIRDLGPFNVSDKKWVIHFDVDCDLDEVRRLQKWIYSQGFKWVAGLTIDQMAGDCDTKYFFSTNYDWYGDFSDNKFDGYARWNDDLEWMIDNEGYELFKWSEIRKHLNPQ